MSKGRLLLSFACASGASWILLLLFSSPPDPRACSTFLLSRESTLLVGHNLDDDIKVPGLVVVNPRGLAKENVSFDDLNSFGGRSDSAPRIRWTSRYGSVTYNVFGREFPDGGMNEAGLYMGEMTLMSTEWPETESVPRAYHHQWTQYMLDNYATVPEALAAVPKLLPGGHCRWHYFLSDKQGNAAVIEFLKGRPIVYTGDTLPYPILCNDPYDLELKDLRNYAGFGGTKKPEPKYEREDPRFRWAALMLQGDTSSAPTVDDAFSILRRLNMGNNKWAVVLDVPGGRIYFRTSTAPKTRWADFAAFDFSCTATPSALDIQRELEGDVSKLFTPLTPDANRDFVKKAWAEIDAGFFGNMFFKPRMIKRLGAAAAAVQCAGE